VVGDEDIDHIGTAGHDVDGRLPSLEPVGGVVPLIDRRRQLIAERFKGSRGL